MNPWQWHLRAVCSCGWSTPAPFGEYFHVHRDVCADCGNPKPKSNWNQKGWQIKTGKVISTAIWYKPWTWNDSKVIYKDYDDAMAITTPICDNSHVRKTS